MIIWLKYWDAPADEFYIYELNLGSYVWIKMLLPEIRSRGVGLMGRRELADSSNQMAKSN